MAIGSSTAYRDLLAQAARNALPSMASGAVATATASSIRSVGKGLDVSTGSAQTRAVTAAVVAQLLGGSSSNATDSSPTSLSAGASGNARSRNATADAVQATITAMVAQMASGLPVSRVPSTAAPLEAANDTTVENGTANALKRVLDAYAQHAADA